MSVETIASYVLVVAIIVMLIFFAHKDPNG